jgi:hypothetical protein
VVRTGSLSHTAAWDWAADGYDCSGRDWGSHPLPLGQTTGRLRRTGAGVHDSRKSHRDKGITKQGRRDLRFVLVEAARTAVQTHPYWKREFARLAKRIGDHKAVVAIARKLLIVVWHVLLAKSADRRADAEQVAFKLMVWSWKLNDEQRGGLTSRQFIRAHLIRLGLGEELTHITRGGTKRGLATIEEVLALRPELRAPPNTA